MPNKEEREVLAQQAKDYVRNLYLSHREDDVDAWNGLIDVIFSYCDQVIDYHCAEKHSDV